MSWAKTVINGMLHFLCEFCGESKWVIVWQNIFSGYSHLNHMVLLTLYYLKLIHVIKYTVEFHFLPGKEIIWSIHSLLSWSCGSISPKKSECFRVRKCKMFLLSRFSHKSKGVKLVLRFSFLCKIFTKRWKKVKVRIVTRFRFSRLFFYP